ncbi:hypothetical protein [Streptococcus suis]|uniref:hypothetical protein n=1 Tax=Streptococcus suis TaxID=1307 RepID=UPI001ABE5DB1|nr:hypothetical protein [Streptococcus suis]
MLVRFYKLTRLSQDRERTHRSENQSLLKIILVVTIALFFAFLTTICNVQTGLLVNTLVLYLLLAYNYDFTLKEFSLDKFKVYRTNSSHSTRLFLYLFMENNPLATASILHILATVLMNVQNLSKVLIIVNSVLLVLMWLGLKLLSHLYYKFLGICLILMMVVCAICGVKFIILLTVIQLVYMIILIMTLKKELRFFGVNSEKSDYQSKHIRGITLYNFVIHNIMTEDYRKSIVKILGSLLAGFIFYYIFHSDGSSIFLFILLLELELLLDKKYKHQSNYISKYYFLRNSFRNLLERFLLSDNYIASIKILMYMLITGIAGRVPLGRLSFQIVVIILLGFVYYWAEEKMFEKQQKVNSFLFQYLTFIVLFVTTYLASFIGG